MKCKKCGHVNRKEAKHCKKCGEPLKPSTNILCQSCGHKNLKSAKFCEECGIELTASAPTAAKPRLLREEQSTPPPVVVQVREEKKRRLNPLWLIAPLLLVICCCGLLLLFQGRVPDFAAPYVDPIINPINEQVEKVLPGLQDFRQAREVSCDELRIAYPVCFDDTKPGDIFAGPKPDDGDGNVKRPPDQAEKCDNLRNQMDEQDLFKGTTECDADAGFCWTGERDISGLDNHEDIEVYFRWGQDELEKAYCEGAPKAMRCRVPYKENYGIVEYYLKLDDCVEFLAENDGFQGEAGKKPAPSNCEEFKKRVGELPYSTDKKNCYEDFCIWFPADLSDLGLDDIEDLKVIIQDGSTKVEANCKGDAKEWNCRYPPELESPTVIFKYKDCEVIYCAFLPEYEGMCKEPQTDISLLTDPSSDCCEITNVSNVRYEGVEFVSRKLNFDVECDGDWPISEADEISGKAWIGAEYDIDWADVTCTLSSKKNLLSCESDDSVPQKNSQVKAELSYGDCSWMSTKFQTPEMFIPSAPAEEEECSNLSSDGVTCLD